MKITYFLLHSLIIVFATSLLGCAKETETDWKESALFESGGYTMIGEQGRKCKRNKSSSYTINSYFSNSSNRCVHT